MHTPTQRLFTRSMLSLLMAWAGAQGTAHAAPSSPAPAGALADAAAASASNPRGRWITANGNLEVDIAPCGAALCGTVTKVLGNRSMSRDGAEMDPVDKRPALGMVLLRDFVRTHEGESDDATPVWSGDIYNRENGKTYRCRMSMANTPGGTGTLVLRAYVGLPLFGKTQRWQRAARLETSSAAPHSADQARR